MEQWNWGTLLNDSFQNEFQEGYLEVTPDAGIPFRRERFSDIQDIVSGNLSLTEEDYIDFMSWYKFNIRQGTIPFLFYDCRVKSDRVARLTINKPQFNRQSNRWNISVTLAFNSGIFFINEKLVCNSDYPIEANGKILEISAKRYL